MTLINTRKMIQPFATHDHIVPKHIILRAEEENLRMSDIS